MGQQALEVADIFRLHGPAWRLAQRGHLSLAQLKVMSAIEQCRSAALGGHVLRCEGCGTDQIAYNSCRNRHCSARRNAAPLFLRDPREGSLDRHGPQWTGQRGPAAHSNAAPARHRAHAIAIARADTTALAAVSSLEACSTPALPCGHHVAGASLGQVSNKPRRQQTPGSSWLSGCYRREQMVALRA